MNTILSAGYLVNGLALVRDYPYNGPYMSVLQTRLDRGILLRIMVFIAAAIVLGVWLAFTPPGILGKADAIGYAVCHRIAVRSFFLGDRQFPLCARCSGMYLGTLLGLIYQIRLGKLGGMPSLKFSIVLGVFLVAFGIDGVNSYLHFFPSAPSLYEPQNWLRLVTGTGMGIGIGAVLMPIFNQSVWADWSGKPALHSWPQLAALIGMAGLIDLAMWGQNPLILFPLALLSSATILVVLSMIYTIVWMLILKKENSYRSLHEVSTLLAAGFTVALLQIAVMDIIRLALTHTWNGFFS